MSGYHKSQTPRFSSPYWKPWLALNLCPPIQPAGSWDYRDVPSIPPRFSLHNSWNEVWAEHQERKTNSFKTEEGHHLLRGRCFPTPLTYAETLQKGRGEEAKERPPTTRSSDPRPGQP